MIRLLVDGLLEKLYNRLDKYLYPRKKNKAYYYPNPPRNIERFIRGDIWFDTSDKMKLYTYTNRGWIIAKGA